MFYLQEKKNLEKKCKSTLINTRKQTSSEYINHKTETLDIYNLYKTKSPYSLFFSPFSLSLSLSHSELIVFNWSSSLIEILIIKVHLRNVNTM
jgi:hypothetical protein